MLADDSPVPAAQLLTARLRLVAPDEALAAAVADFHERNRDHLAPWEPPAGHRLDGVAARAAHLREATSEFARGTGFRYLLQPIGDPARVIGSVHFSNVVRGAFQSCNLGYALDRECEGQALMTEALRCAIGEMFSPGINLHRIQAAYRPENWRSAEVLKRLHFQDEGLCPDYLFIDGAWRIHRLVALLNRAFVTPAEWNGA